jgi:hypothetical protein
VASTNFNATAAQTRAAFLAAYGVTVDAEWERWRTFLGEQYRTIDRWESRAAWEAFRARYEAMYEGLDERATSVTGLEQLVEETEIPRRDD